MGNDVNVVGLISDTHGLLRAEALKALEGSDLIIHAGDVGGPEIIDALQALAPVAAVRGNTDRGAWADALPMTVAPEADQSAIYVVHALQRPNPAPGAGGGRSS